MNLKDLQDKKGNRFAVPKTVRLTIEAAELLERVEAAGKNPADFLREAAERELEDTFPGELKRLRDERRLRISKPDKTA